jgi:hypothetical protein
MPDDIPVLAHGGTVGYEHGRPSHGPPELAVVGGDAAENTGARGDNARGVGGVGARNTGAIGA